jgi:hypothetical protein
MPSSHGNIISKDRQIYGNTGLCDLGFALKEDNSKEIKFVSRKKGNRRDAENAEVRRECCSADLCALCISAVTLLA